MKEFFTFEAIIFYVIKYKGNLFVLGQNFFTIKYYYVVFETNEFIFFRLLKQDLSLLKLNFPTCRSSLALLFSSPL